MEVTGRVKHSSLVQYGGTYGRKKFYTTATEHFGDLNPGLAERVLNIFCEKRARLGPEAKSQQIKQHQILPCLQYDVYAA
jgi:hypothetical protein